MTKKAKRRQAIVSVIEGMIGTLLIFGFFFVLILVAELTCGALGVG